MYLPLLFTASSHFSTILSITFRQKPPGIEEVIELVFKVLFIVDGTAPHQQGAEIGNPSVQGLEHTTDAEELSIRVLEVRFDHLCNMETGVAVKEYGLAFSMGSFQSNSLFQRVYLGYVEPLVNCGFPTKRRSWSSLTLVYLLEPATPFFAQYLCIRTISQLP